MHHAGGGLRRRLRAPSSRRISSRRAPISSPASASSPTRPSNTRSQKRRRARGSRKRAAHLVAEDLGEAREAADRGRQRALDLGAQPARQRGRGAAGRDGDGDRPAIDDRGHDEARQRRTVDDVHRQAAPLGGVRDAAPAGGRRRSPRSPALTPSRSAASKSRPAQAMRPSAINWAISPVTVSAINVTCAPADSSSSVLRAAGSLPPTTSARRSLQREEEREGLHHAAFRTRGRAEQRANLRAARAAVGAGPGRRADGVERRGTVGDRRVDARPSTRRSRRRSRRRDRRHRRRAAARCAASTLRRSIAMNGAQTIARGLVVRFAQHQHGLEPAVGDHRSQCPPRPRARARGWSRESPPTAPAAPQPAAARPPAGRRGSRRP